MSAANHNLVTLDLDTFKLEQISLSDFDAYVDFWLKEAKRGKVPNFTPSKEHIWARLLRFIGHWQSFGYGAFLLKDTSQDRIIGELGLALFYRDVENKSDSIPEAFWTISFSERGNNYAALAMGEILKWAENNTEIQTSNVMITSSNIPSLKIANKLGYHKYGQSLYQDETVYLFSRDIRKTIEPVA